MSAHLTARAYSEGIAYADRTALHFPDGPKLELDELLEQLVERARGVQHSQGRLRALLRAVQAVSADLDVESVLRNVVEAACELADARFAALGVVAHDGSLERFVHTGMAEADVAAIGHLPRGLGLLGALIHDPSTIRRDHLADDDRSVGFPAGHPPMESFLGVAVEVRGAVFGNLYLTDSRHGHFSAEDEELVTALAAAAGLAVGHARILAESQLQQRWQAASIEIGAQLLAATGEDPLHLIARRTVDLADVDLVTVSLLTPGGEGLMVEVATGEGADDLVGRCFDVATTFAGRSLDVSRALVVPEDETVDRVHFADASLDVGPLMVLPLQGAQQARGVLSLVRRRGRRPFTDADLAMAAGFAGHASLALELADARAAEQRVVLLEDRGRIARDLHDHVIQQLFAIGISLESAARLVGDNGPVAARIHDRVVDIDRTIRRIRTSIFELRGPLDARVDGLRQRVLGIASDLIGPLGFAPNVAFAGLLDVTVPNDVADDVAACVREALSNAAKHASATDVEVDVSLQDGELTVLVSDDGIGIGGEDRPAGWSGLANLRTRADARGGSFAVSRRTPTGTTVTWKVPLS